MSLILFRDSVLNLKLEICKVLFAVCLLLLSLPTDAKDIESYELTNSEILLELEYSNKSIEPYTDRLVSLVDMYLVEGEKLFGGPPKKLDGSAYTKLRIKLSKISKGLGGEADPEQIEFRLSDSKLFGFYGWEIGILHEVLHLWSAETFRYQDDQEQWFNEGVTEYLTFRLAAKLGLIEKSHVIDVFSKPISTYLSAKGIGKYSLRSAASTKELKRDHYFLVYHGGFVAGMVLDHQIRLKSNRKFTLEDLMSQMYDRFSRDKLYTSNSILELINESFGLDFSSFFERHIDGNEVILVGDYFDFGMLTFSEFGVPIKGINQQVLHDMLDFE